MSAQAGTAAPLAGLHAVVTGGGRGIGFAIADASRRDGRHAVAARPRPRRGSTRRCGDCPTAPPRTRMPATWPTRGPSTRPSRRSPRTGRKPAILVNNAGVAKSAKLAATSDALWSEMLGANLTGTFLCTRAALPALLEAPFARIVNVASTAALIGYPYVAAYCAAKHGVVGLTRALALELAGTAVTVNAVCPGYTDTDLVREAVAAIVRKTGRTADEARAALAGRNPQKRLVEPDEVAAAVAWLCLPESKSVTGQAIAVAGGEVMG